MKAVVYRGVNDLQLENVPEPHIQLPTDVVIKVNLSTICGGDLHLKASEFMKPGTIIGHEYCGVVVDTGAKVTRFKKGDRVLGRPVFYCGHCFYCEHNQPDLCDSMSMFGTGETPGVQAEYARIPFADSTLEKIPDDMADEDVIFVGDILSTGYTGVLRGNVRFGDTVAIFGAGPIGLSAAACAPFLGPSLVIVVDIVDYRLDFARSLGAVTINASREDAIAKIKELTEGRGADVSVEAGGFEATLRACFQATRRGGRIDVLGIFLLPTPLDFAECEGKKFTLTMGPGDLSHVNDLLQMIRAGKLKPQRMMTHRMPLSEALRGYELFEKKLDGCIKVVFEC